MVFRWFRSDSSLDGRELDDLEYDADPLYDESLDEKDSEWTAKLRNGRVSDAILSCPCCFTTVCIDCQEHTSMIGHFRAMLVMNCRVDTGQKRGFKNSSLPKKRALEPVIGNADTRAVCQKLNRSSSVEGSKNKMPAIGNEAGSQSITGSAEVEQHEGGFAVFCRVCETELAVYDKEGVYHFFDVFPSAA